MFNNQNLTFNSINEAFTLPLQVSSVLSPLGTESIQSREERVTLE